MRRFGWIVWLFIALLPLRGVAHSVMNALPPAPPAAMAMADGEPCPMQAAMNTAAGCTQCDLCCAVVAPAPAAHVPAMAQATPAPAVSTPAALPPAPLDRLYRPPR
jgi:hypothetical protein